MGTFITGFKLNDDSEYDQRLFHAINYGWGEVEVLTSGRDHGRVGAHQGQGQTTKKLTGHLAFLHLLTHKRQTANNN